MNAEAEKSKTKNTLYPLYSNPPNFTKFLGPVPDIYRNSLLLFALHPLRNGFRVEKLTGELEIKHIVILKVWIDHIY